MALANHDYKCPACGGWVIDYLVDMAIGGRAGAPLCPRGCTLPDRSTVADDPSVPLVPVRTVYWPTKCRIDAYDVRGFDIHDGRGNLRHVETLRDIRTIEKESEQIAANGEGSQLVWRTYAQDRSNKDQHTMAKRLDRAMDDQDRPDLTIPIEKLQVAAGQAVRDQHSESGGSTALPESPGEW